VVLDCSAIGHISVVLDSCLFTPDNADYTQTYAVSTINSTTSDRIANPDCFGEISSNSDDISLSWTYSEAEMCGWEWTKIDTQLAFGAAIRPSDNINKVLSQG